jgi:hypothetical protein
MSQTISGSAPYVPPNFYAQALPGMIADSIHNNVDTFACDTAPIGFGLVAGRVAAASMKIKPGGTAPIGITLYDHVIASRGGFTQYDAVSCLTRGRVWAVVDSATNVDDGVYVYFVPATGTVNATPTGNTALPKAIFRSKTASVFNLLGGAPVLVAVVELGYPLSVG